MLSTGLPRLDDPEGDRLPGGLPPVIDAHVHVFPDRVFDALWRWFDEHAWPIRYRLGSQRSIDFLAARGVARIVALHYAHKPGVARQLNQYAARLASDQPDQICAAATVYPGEPEAEAILDEALQIGLRPVKLHAHVQAFDLASDAFEAICDHCDRTGRPLVVHGGREPKSPAYPRDPHLLCAATKVERILERFPGLRLCIPHLGADEFVDYRDLIARFDNLWVDTSVAIAGYLPAAPPPLSTFRLDRVMYGSDFPNLPYAWDREIKRLAAMDLPADGLRRVLGQNAVDFFGLEP